MPRALALSLPWDWLSLLFPCAHLNIASQEPDTNRQGRKMWLSLIDTVFLQEFSSWLIPVKQALSFSEDFYIYIRRRNMPLERYPFLTLYLK